MALASTPGIDCVGLKAMPLSASSSPAVPLFGCRCDGGSFLRFGYLPHPLLRFAHVICHLLLQFEHLSVLVTDRLRVSIWLGSKAVEFPHVLMHLLHQRQLLLAKLALNLVHLLLLVQIAERSVT